MLKYMYFVVRILYLRSCDGTCAIQPGNNLEMEFQHVSTRWRIWTTNQFNCQQVFGRKVCVRENPPFIFYLYNLRFRHRVKLKLNMLDCTIGLIVDVIFCINAPPV